MKEIKVKVTYTEELLGTAPSNSQLYEDFIASNAPDAPTRQQEIEAHGVKEVTEKAMTVFPRLNEDELFVMGFKDTDDVPFTWDYQWKGYFKDSCGMLRRATGTLSSKFTAYKKQIDGLVFVKERKIPLILPDGGEIGECQRPLRADTPQGPRVALAYSETVPAGTTQEFTIVVLNDKLVDIIHEWLDYGALHGTGQWRNSGKGRYVYDLLDSEGNVIGGNNIHG
jgi:hypothetical protein